MTDKITYGLQIYTRYSHGCHHVSAMVMRREHSGDRQDQPLGISSDDQYRAYRDNEPKHLVGLQMQGLGMDGFVSAEYAKSPDDIHFIGHDIEYRDVYSIDLDDASRMLKTLKLVHKRAETDNSHEPGDLFASLCVALKLSWVCELRDNDTSRRFPEWRWMSVGEGRNRYRQLIAEAVSTAIATKFQNSVAA